MSDYSTTPSGTPSTPPNENVPAGGVETKVAASAGGAAGGAAIAALIVYLLDQVVYTGGRWGEDVPGVVTLAVGVILAGLGSLVAGFRAPHTRR